MARIHMCKYCVYYLKGYCILADFYVKKNWACPDFELEEEKNV